MPKVTVIMAVFNREKYVGESINSILSQSFTDFELVIIDDGSTDGTIDIVKGYNDSRINLVQLPSNFGISTARNVGLKMAAGEFVAIMDSDDIAMPDRLAAQVAFLDEHSEVHILGTGVRKILANKTEDQYHPTDDSIIKANLLSLDGSSMINASTMMRRKFLSDNSIYYEIRPIDEDHGLWINAMAAGANFHNLRDILMHYRRHEGNITSETSPQWRSYQALKTPLRAKLLGLLFPDLTHLESQALARLMEFSATLDIVDASLGVASAAKVQRYSQNMFGASQSHINAIVEKYRMNAVNSLNNILN